MAVVTLVYFERTAVVKVLVVTGYFWPALRYGGTVSASWGLTRALAAQGAQVRVVTVARGGDELPEGGYGWQKIEGLEIFYARRWMHPDFGPALFSVLRQQVRWADVVHCYSVFGVLLPLVAVLCARQNLPLILSSEGALLPEARMSKAWKKRPYERLVIGPLLRHVARIVAASKPEANAIRLAFPKVSVSVVPNGVDTADGALPRVAPTRPYLIYLGRLHPHKRVDAIIQAFAASGANSGWLLHIAGDGSAAYKARLKTTANEAGVMNSVRFLGHLGPLERSRELACAEGLILFSRSEGFGMSVAEALAHGTPCVVGRPTCWEAIEQEGCGFVVDGTVESLANGISRLAALSEPSRREMGERGMSWMRADYSWDAAASSFMKIYHDAMRGNA